MSDAEKLASAIEKVVDDKITKALRGGSKQVIATYEGTDSEGKPWVTLAGATSATPTRRSSVEAARGDTVSVTVGDGMAVIDANLTDKSAGMAGVAKADSKATVAQETAVKAIDYATQASAAASSAQSSADSAVSDAARANMAATQAISDAADAATAASSAQASATSAQSSANKATYALSDVEKVVGTVNWIAEHGTYSLTEDAAVDSSKTYYTRSGTSPNYTYTVVADPVASGLSTYYELSIDESVQNFLAAHVWLDLYGLNLSVDSANGYRVHQGTVNGSHAAGTYILDPEGEVVARLSADGSMIGAEGGWRTEFNRYGMEVVGNASMFEVSSAVRNETVNTSYVSEVMHYAEQQGEPGDGVFYGFVIPLPSGFMSPSDISALSWYDAQESIGVAGNTALQPSSQSVYFTRDYPLSEALFYPASSLTGTGELTGMLVHDGSGAIADYFPERDPWVRVGGTRTEVSYTYTAEPHMRFGTGTLASSDDQTAIGRWNVEDANNEYAFIIGNGTADDARSNALAVKWNGNVTCGAVNGCGTQVTDSQSDPSFANSSNGDVASVSLAAGVWMVCGKVQFASNSTGRRAVKLSTTSGDSGNPVSTVAQNAVSGATTQMSTSRLFKLPSAATVYLVAWQNSGGTLAVSGDIEATRLG